MIDESNNALIDDVHMSDQKRQEKTEPKDKANEIKPIPPIFRH